MPRYYLNGKVYNIPDDLSSDFEKDNPSAITSYKRDEDIYDIPVYEKDGFLKSFPNAVPYETTLPVLQRYLVTMPLVDYTN